MQSQTGNSMTDQIYSLYKNTVVQHLLSPTQSNQTSVVQKPLISSSNASMNKIEEIEPEPEIIQQKNPHKLQSARSGEVVEDF